MKERNWGLLTGYGEGILCIKHCYMPGTGEHDDDDKDDPKDPPK